MQTAREIGQDRAGFIVRMSSDIEDARGNPRIVDGFDGFSQAGTGARGGRKLSSRALRRDEQNRHAC
jgi:hypothetical protein